MYTSLTISTDCLKFLVSGPNRLISYYKKIKQNHKRKESILHFLFILFGLISGILLAPTVIIDLPLYIIKIFGLEKIKILVIIGFTISTGVIFSSILYGISKTIVDIYNINKYGFSNSQYAPLTKEEIDNIYNNSLEYITISKDGIESLHSTICTFIKAQNYKIEKQRLKSAHWLFRRGSISNACKSHPLISDAVAASMNDTITSRDFIRRNTNIAHLTSHIENGIPCNTIEDRVFNITNIVKKVMSELIILQSMLDMGTEGIINIPIISRRISSENITELS